MNKIFAIFLIVMAFAVKATDNTCSFSQNKTSRKKTDKTTLPPAPHKTEENFKLIINQVTSLYAATVRELGAELVATPVWDREDENAYAQKDYHNIWRVVFYGAYYRTSKITDDAFALTVCHELGHLLGGAPFERKTELSVEGQADFWAASVCLKKYFTSYPLSVSMPEGSAKKSCDQKYTGDKNATQVCYRSSLAAQALTDFFSDDDEDDSIPPELEKKDPSVLLVTEEDHPESQCRLDTYLAGSLCSLDDNFPSFEKKLLSDLLVSDTLCNEVVDGQLMKIEKRPACWFNSANHSLDMDYKARVNSKVFLTLGKGMITLSYYNHLPGTFNILLIPDPESDTAKFVKVTSKNYTMNLPRAGAAQTLIFNYEFIKKAYRKKLKFLVIVEKDGTEVLRDAIQLKAYSYSPI